MILHIGENISILERDIISILDKKAVDSSRTTRRFINKLIEEGCLYNTIDKGVKTYIITCKKEIHSNNRRRKSSYVLYTSNISSTTLAKRNTING
ncbi:DUF370 domain-containing protein [Tissierella sp. MSJ-40]|uniref:DUF370 domain-containing protein n=1 Tax=Tissierella simiarum TaxID=2841534 RepID=A0ABS6E559_9FIRM|nr:DUF370 domain-containing protein [Tissierella simiarum]MBU5437966.1 DUF370 domain-containing protein [Tissierella simiarum]